ncbi:MAG: hypothetical protein DRJ15_11790 [Bacteroidetes bacterium]|nr:MAG: hypothetical protein DRJ15_11790 [Bacteroidota bacterium]
MRYITSLILLLTSFCAASAQKTKDAGLQSITLESVEAPLEFLASDWTEGREVGTKGAYMAADYIASLFKLYGIRPLGDMAVKKMSRESRMAGGKPESYRSYFQNFDLLTGPRKSEISLSLINRTAYSAKELTLIKGADFELRGISSSMEIEAPVVFLGYGLQSEALKCDPFEKVNLEGKIVFLLSGFAGIDDQESENYRILKSDSTRSFRQIERDKVENARKAGALALVRYNPHRAFIAANPSNLPMHHDNEYYEGDEKKDDFYLKEIFLPNWNKKEELPVVEISRSMAESILNKSDDLLSSMLDPGYQMSSFKSVNLPETIFHLTAKKEQEVIRARNVLGYIEGENHDEVIVIGGHYDHVGKYNGFTFNGADDNVSGTVGMLSLARAFMQTGMKPAKTIVFAAWTGEEQGLWGSKYFVKNIPDDLNIILNINMDMISRTSLKDSTGNYLSLRYTKGYEEYEQIFRTINDVNKFNLDIDYRSEEQPRGGSDFTSFAMEGIPVISLFTGLHKDYHMPNDEIEFMNLEKMVAIIKLTYNGLNEILEKGLDKY